MTLSQRLGLSNERERWLTRGLQVVLLGITGYGIATLQFMAILSGGLGLLVTLLPALLRREYGYTMDPGLVLWITIALVLNAFGFLGLYQEYGWYDEITHTLSATLVAGLGYAAFRAFEEHSAEVDVPPAFRSAFIVVFVLAAAVFWELLEFASELLADALGLGPPLVVFGIYDIVTDMIFNTVGAVLVALWGTNHFSGVVAFFSNRLGRDGRS